MLLIAVWSILVYAPIARWVFNPNGWISAMGAHAIQRTSDSASMPIPS